MIISEKQYIQIEDRINDPIIDELFDNIKEEQPQLIHEEDVGMIKKQFKFNLKHLKACGYEEIFDIKDYLIMALAYEFLVFNNEHVWIDDILRNMAMEPEEKNTFLFQLLLENNN